MAIFLDAFPHLFASIAFLDRSTGLQTLS